ncbi:hypothetical protein ACFX1T_012877 [Malus domestica]
MEPKVGVRHGRRLSSSLSLSTGEGPGEIRGESGQWQDNGGDSGVSFESNNGERVGSPVEVLGEKSGDVISPNLASVADGDSWCS